MVSIGDKARQLRLRHGLTLEQVHQRTGISVSHLSAIENGTRPNPSFRNVLKLARTYDVPVCYFSDEGACAYHGHTGQGAATADGPSSADKGGPSPRAAAYDPPHRGNLALDADTWALITSDHSRPYLALARRLMDADALTDQTSQVLQVIAEFIREQRAPQSPTPSTDEPSPE